MKTKKTLMLLFFLMTAVMSFATQIKVVGEVFTESW